MKSTTLNLQMQAGNATQTTANMKALSDAMTEVGFVKHTTTGQIDLTTSISYPGSFTGGTYYQIGFEIRKLVSVGKPTIFCRVYYALFAASSAATSVGLQIRLQYGSSVDASGNIGGVVPGYDPVSVQAGTTSVNTAYPMWCASDGQNYFTLVIGTGVDSWYSYPPFGCTLERTRDQVSGAYDSQGAIYLMLGGAVNNSESSAQWGSYGTASRYGIFDFNSSYAKSVTNPCYATPANLHNNSTGVAGASALFPLLVSMPAIKANATMAIGYYHTEVAAGTEFNATMYGSTITFMASGNTFTAYDGNNGSSAVRSALRIN